MKLKKLLSRLFNFFKNLFKKEEQKVETKSKFKYGWVKDSHDPNDHKFKIVKPRAVPTSVDLRPQMPPVYDQGDLGSCTANALAGAYQFEQMKQKEKDFVPSRLFIYYNERSMEGTVNEDSGAMIRDGIKSMDKNHYGVCPETMWTYDIKKFKNKPCRQCYNEAKKSQVEEYLRIADKDLNTIKSCLADGYPIAFGFVVYESFESQAVAETGMAPMPKPGETELGGHAVLCVGFSDEKQALLVRNSWGTGWGLEGYFWLPYGYVTEGLSDDFWTIRLVE